MLKAGLGRAEVLALKWSDVNLKTRTISIMRTVTETNGVLATGEPKTQARKADVPIDDEIIAALNRIPKFIESDYVFPNSKGGLFSPSDWSSRNYKRFMMDYDKFHFEKYNDHPRKLTPHELRHTFGSLVYEATRDIYITSKLMRHSSVDITAKIYVHTQVDAKHEALESLNNIL